MQLVQVGVVWSSANCANGKLSLQLIASQYCFIKEFKLQYKNTSLIAYLSYKTIQIFFKWWNLNMVILNVKLRKGQLAGGTLYKD